MDGYRIWPVERSSKQRSSRKMKRREEVVVNENSHMTFRFVCVKMEGGSDL